MKEKNKNNPSIIKDVKIRPDLISEDKSLPTSKEKIGKQKLTIILIIIQEEQIEYSYIV